MMNDLDKILLNQAQIMAALALLLNRLNPPEEEIANNLLGQADTSAKYAQRRRARAKADAPDIQFTGPEYSFKIK